MLRKTLPVSCSKLFKRKDDELSSWELTTYAADWCEAQPLGREQQQQQRGGHGVQQRHEGEEQPGGSENMR